jgi:hypothetical protein
MLMPEAPMDENDLAQLWKDHIRNPWNVAHVQPVSETHPVYEASNEHFGAGISPFDA